MNSLEFINQEIEFLEDMISMDLSLVEDDFDLQEIHKKQQRLRHLKQIKSELEAWEVIKNKIYYDSSKEYIDLSLIYLGCIKDKNYQKLKKALEVKENVD